MYPKNPESVYYACRNRLSKSERHSRSGPALQPEGFPLWAGLAVLRRPGRGVGAVPVLINFDVPTSEGPFVAPNEPILTLSDTFPDATDPGNTLRHFLLRVDEYKPDISGTGKI